MNRYYGFDKLGMLFMLLSIILAIIALPLWTLPAGTALIFFSTLFLIIAFYRMTSTNRLRRERELAVYQRLLTALAGFFKRGPKIKTPKQPKIKKVKRPKRTKRTKGTGKGSENAERDPNYAYFSCPVCRKNLRAPRNLGSIKIICPQCGHQFMERT